MHMASLLGSYCVWHYTRAYRDLISIERNLLWFLFHFFSIPELSRTLFAPWRRLGEEYPSVFDTEEFFGALIINTLMRIIGISIRFIILTTGCVVLLLGTVLAGVALVVWTLLPLLIIFTFVTGVLLIFQW